MQSDADRSPWKQGALILGVCALVPLLVLADRCEPEGHEWVFVRTHDAMLAVDGSPVRIHGVEVGRVTDVCLYPTKRRRWLGSDGRCTEALLAQKQRTCEAPARRHDAQAGSPAVLLVLEVDRRVVAEMRDDAVVEIVNMLPSVTRTSLTLDVGKGEPLRPDHTICAASDWSLPKSIEMTLAKVRDVLSAAEGRIEDVGRLVSRIDAATAEGGLVGALLERERAEEVGTILAEAARAVRSVRLTVDAASGDARRTVTNLRVSTDALAGGSSEAVAEVNAALATLNRSLLNLEAALGSLRDASTRSPEAMDRAVASVEEVQRTIHGVQQLPVIRGSIAPRRTAPVMPGQPHLVPPVDAAGAPRPRGSAP